MHAQIDSPEALGRVIRRVRTDNALNQRELADLLMVSQRYLSELENGKPKIADKRYFDMLRRLGIVLRAEVDDR